MSDESFPRAVNGSIVRCWLRFNLSLRGRNLGNVFVCLRRFPNCQKRTELPVKWKPAGRSACVFAPFRPIDSTCNTRRHVSNRNRNWHEDGRTTSPEVDRKKFIIANSGRNFRRRFTRPSN
uniref:(northern house mosquito) hypothetical protein n=1 Tax=Culex pipiens TaxID=7175 RepID=A0A8D8BXI1_CULPI